MIVGTILLTSDNFYVTEDGKLPARSSFDKQLLHTVMAGEIVSDEGYMMLPPSIQSVVAVDDKWLEPTVGVTIPEIDALSDLLIVVHSNEIIVRGKQFRLDNFELIVKDKKISLYKRKS